MRTPQWGSPTASTRDSSPPTRPPASGKARSPCTSSSNRSGQACPKNYRSSRNWAVRCGSGTARYSPTSIPEPPTAPSRPSTVASSTCADRPGVPEPQALHLAVTYPLRTAPEPDQCTLIPEGPVKPSTHICAIDVDVDVHLGTWCPELSGPPADF